MKQNCWDYKNCGRAPGGHAVKDLGVCPVSTYTALHGMHGGINAGRSCWVVAGSLCGGKIQGNEAQKRTACWNCGFLHLVKKEEESAVAGFSHTRLGMDRVLQKTRQSAAGLS